MPIVLRTVVHAQDISLLQQRGQAWYEKFEEVETDEVISYVGRRRLWQFKSLQLQVHVTIPEGTYEQQCKKLN